MPKTTYDDQGVTSTYRGRPAGGGGGGTSGATKDLLEKLLRKRLRERLGRGDGGRAIAQGGGAGRPRHHRPATPPAKLGGKAGTDAQLDATRKRAEIKQLNALSRGVPKKYVHPGGGGGAYLVDDWDNVALGMRPGNVHLTEGSDVALRHRQRAIDNAVAQRRMDADRERSRKHGLGAPPMDQGAPEEAQPRRRRKSLPGWS